jgi:hypothetical protein
LASCHLWQDAWHEHWQPQCPYSLDSKWSWSRHHSHLLGPTRRQVSSFKQTPRQDLHLGFLPSLRGPLTRTFVVAMPLFTWFQTVMKSALLHCVLSGFSFALINYQMSDTCLFSTPTSRQDFLHPSPLDLAPCHLWEDTWHSRNVLIHLIPNYANNLFLNSHHLESCQFWLVSKYDPTLSSTVPFPEIPLWKGWTNGQTIVKKVQVVIETTHLFHAVTEENHWRMTCCSASYWQELWLSSFFLLIACSDVSIPFFFAW